MDVRPTSCKHNEDSLGKPMSEWRAWMRDARTAGGVLTGATGVGFKIEYMVSLR